MEIAAILREARHRAARTQADVATRAGTSQATVAAYENSRKSPSLATLSRLAQAMGTTLRVELLGPGGDEFVERPASLLNHQERRSLWLHRAVAVRIQFDPTRARAIGHENLVTGRNADSGSRGEPWWRTWEALLDGPLEELLVVLCSTSTYASQLRQTAPFAGLLAPSERWAVYRAFGGLREPHTA